MIHLISSIIHISLHSIPFISLHLPFTSFSCQNIEFDILLQVNKNMPWIAVQPLCSFIPWTESILFHYPLHTYHNPSSIFIHFHNISPILQKHFIFMIEVFYRNILQLNGHSAADQPFCSPIVFPQLQVLKASTSRHQNPVNSCIKNIKKIVKDSSKDEQRRQRLHKHQGQR